MRRYIQLLAITGLVACGAYDSNAPYVAAGDRTDGFLSQTVSDPLGDTATTGGKQWDLTALTVSRDTGGVTVLLDFSADVISPVGGDTAGIIGFVELDLDQNPATGLESDVDIRRHDGGATLLGVDATVDFTQFATDGTVAVHDTLARVTGRVRPSFAGQRITIRIPRAVIGNDDGFVNAAALIGSVHRPSDFVPQAGHLTLGRPGGG